MSTHSRIGILFDGNIEHVYCHFDGYPEHMLPVLNKNYCNDTEAFALVSLGNLSCIDMDPDKTEAYHKDRGEDWDKNEPIQGDSMNEFKQAMSDEYAQHGYLFDCNKHKWIHVKI